MHEETGNQKKIQSVAAREWYTESANIQVTTYRPSNWKFIHFISCLNIVTLAHFIM